MVVVISKNSEEEENQPARRSNQSTPLDEVELALNLLKQTHPELIENKTYYQISKSLNSMYKISCSEDDIFLLYEPTIDNIEEDLRIHFASMGLVY